MTKAITSMNWWLQDWQRKNKEWNQNEINNIKSKLVQKTFSEIIEIVKNIRDHPNQDLLIKNLWNIDNYKNMTILLAQSIRNSQYSVEQILDINNKNDK